MLCVLVISAFLVIYFCQSNVALTSAESDGTADDQLSVRETLGAAFLSPDDTPLPIFRAAHPDARKGLYKILGRRDPATALYLGDNIDDALAARDAGVPFMAIIAPGEHGYRDRAKRFRELGALALLSRAIDLRHWLSQS